MEDKKNEFFTKNGGLIKKIIGGVVVLAVILLIIFLSGDKTPSEESSPVTEETSETNNGALAVVQPVKEGDYEYVFKGVKWTFDTTSPEVVGTNQTWLKMEFADFTRNGNAIAFGTPYKLGVHPGTCKQVDFIDTTSEEGIPFSYARCEGTGIVQDFVVLQNNEEIIVKMNEKKGEVESGWKDWYKIDVTSIVR